MSKPTGRGVGRPPKPTALRILEGVPGHRPLNVNEPKPMRVTPECPEFLHQYAREHWSYLVKELDRLGLMTTVDLGAFTQLCQAWADWRTSVEFVLKTNTGGIYKTKSGYLSQVPQVAIARAAGATYQSLARDFGLTPAARSRISVPPAVGRDNDEDEGLDWSGQV